MGPALRAAKGNLFKLLLRVFQRDMAQTGLMIFLLISLLLLDQTISQASKFKARKHSKRRVKGTGSELGGGIETYKLCKFTVYFK